MAALTDIGKYKLLAEIFVHAMKLETVITAEKNQAAIENLTEYELSERQAESFLNAAFTKYDRGMLRTPEQLLEDIVISFRRREHDYVLSQIQYVLEAGEINPQVQAFYDLVLEHLYHEE